MQPRCCREGPGGDNADAATAGLISDSLITRTQTSRSLVDAWLTGSCRSTRKAVKCYFTGKVRELWRRLFGRFLSLHRFGRAGTEFHQVIR